MKALKLIFAGGLLAFCAACAKEPAAPATPDTGPAPVVLSDDEIPVETQFATEYEGKITDQNYKAELEALATEIGGTAS